MRAVPARTVRPELVEGLSFFLEAEGNGFDELSPNGIFAAARECRRRSNPPNHTRGFP